MEYEEYLEFTDYLCKWFQWLNGSLWTKKKGQISQKENIKWKKIKEIFEQRCSEYTKLKVQVRGQIP